MFRFRRLGWSLLMLGATPAFGQSPSHNGVSYVAPPGWSSGEQNGQLLLAPADATKEMGVIVVLFGAERLEGKSFPDWLAARMASDLNRQAKVLQASPVQNGTAGNLHTLSTGRTVQDAGGGVRLQIYYAIGDGERAAAAMVVATSEAAVTKYTPPIQSLFRSLRFSVASTPSPSIAAAPSSESGATSRTFQNVIYAIPPGWSAKENAGGVAISPVSGLQGEESLTLVVLPGTVSTNLEPVFQSTWQEVCAMLGAESMRTVNGTSYDLESVGRSASGWDFLRGTGGARNAQQRFAISLFLAKVNQRIERVALISREIRVNLTTTNASLNPRFTGAIEEFLFGLRFANWTEPAFPTPKLTGGPIAGVWMGISMFGGKLKTGSAIFLSDGSAWFGSGFPTYGLAGVKPEIESGSDRRRWGRYTFQGGEGVLTTAPGTFPMRLDGEVLVLTTNNTPHRFVRSHPPAGRLSGRYCLESGGCLTLGSDGQFRDEGAARVLEHAVYPYPLTPERGQGSYEIRDYTLLLAYEGGPKIRIAFPGFLDRAIAASSSPAAIKLSFNFDELTKR
jgi:hypothetical protein